MFLVRHTYVLWALLLAAALHLDAGPGAAQETRYASVNLRLRASASTQARAIGSIPRGASVSVRQCAARWCAVRYRGNEGFAARRYLRGSVPPLRAEGRTRPEGRRARGEGHGYTNSRGEHVRSPTFSRSAPAGASARCRDGSYSFSRSRRGTCSRHGGVASWL